VKENAAMDALALLCNLHADGPLTLQRLRRTGLETLESLLELDADELADRIGWEERLSERFLREAWCLSERLEEGLLDREDGESDQSELEASGYQDAGADDQDDADEAESLDHAAAEPEVERVLGAWRDLDEEDPPPPAELPPAQEGYLLPAGRAGGTRGALASSGTPAAPGAATGGLEELPEIDDALRARMVALGITSLDALAGARDLDLARGLELGYTRVARLQFLARRSLAARPARPEPRRPAPPRAEPRFAAPRPEAPEPERSGPRFAAHAADEPTPFDSPAGPFALE
jgi:hypothetical protein